VSDLAAPSFTVASYNVHRCIGTDRRHDPARIARVLRELDADVIGLQEVDSQFHGRFDQLDYLARATGMLAVRGPAAFGNGVLSRRPVLTVRRIDLSVGPREPRGLLDLDLADGVRVLVTHLGLRGADRRVQATRILELLGEDCEAATVLLGDFNEWFRPGRVLRHLHVRLGRTPAAATFPSWRPFFALDRIWVQPRVALAHVGAHRSGLARVASDHLPVRAVIEWPAAPTIALDSAS
jgi:endonuclease/exonuclease/phosphatase family metal-dependent hydrolase